MEVQKRFQKSAKAYREILSRLRTYRKICKKFLCTTKDNTRYNFLVNLDDYERLAEFIEYVSSQYQITPNDVGHWQYIIIIEDIKVDLVKPPAYRITEEFISKRRLIKIKGVGKIYIASPEDLAVLYVISSKQRGTKDIIKAKDIIKYSMARNDFSEEYFLKKCKENNVEYLCLSMLSSV
ncbi:MAG: hypothetical protein RXQ98_09355 [Sulfolobaceae archaeon]